MSASKQTKIDLLVNQYNYYVDHSYVEDGYVVGRVMEFQSLSTHGETDEGALREIKRLVSYVIEDMLDNGEELPKPRRTQ